MSQGIFRVSIRMWLTLLTMIEQRRAFISGTISLRVMASHAYSYKKFWYVDCVIVSPKVPSNPKITQMPVVR